MSAVKPAAVGAFVLGGIAIGVVALLLFGSMRLLTTSVRVMVVFQDSVAGLAIGSPVTFRGVKVGVVQGIKVHINVADLKPVIPVYLDIEPEQLSWTSGSAPRRASELQDAIKAGLRAQLSSLSFVTGQLGVDLDFHPGTPAVLVDHDEGVLEIPTIASDMQHLKNQFIDMNLPELAEKTRQSLATMQRALGELESQIGPLADSVQKTAGAAKTTLETTTAAVHNIQIDTARTLDNIDKLAIESRHQVTTNGKKLEQVLQTAEQTTAEAQKVVATINEATSPRSQMRGDLEASMRDLAASASSLRTFTHNLERSPAGTLMGNAPK